MNGPSAPAEEGGEPGAASPVRQMSLWPPPRSTRHSNRRGRVLLVVSASLLGLGVVAGGAAWSVLSEEKPVAEAVGGIPEEYAGSWSGEMSQYNEAGELVVNWGASLKLDEGTDRGSADWFTLNCRGSVTLVGRSGDGLVFEYAETYDPENRCIDESVLTLSRGAAEGTLAAEWRATSRSGTVMTSTGILK